MAYNPKKSVYLDYNATTPVDPRVLGAFERMCRNTWGNPSSLHSSGIEAWDAVEACRINIGAYFTIDPELIYYCSSASEAIHGALYGTILRDKERTIITSTIEHSAIYHPVYHLRKAGYSVRIVDVDYNGVLDGDQLENLLTQHPRSLLLYSPVNHETGTIQPVADIYARVKKHDCIVFIDGVQAAARIEPAAWAANCDMFTVSGHKIYAPKGIAMLYKKKDVKLRPTRFGGYQNDGLFPGTENTPGIAALSEAIGILKNTITDEGRRLQVLINDGLAILQNRGLDIRIESPKDRAPGVVCISLPWVKDMEALLFYLNTNLICISRFSACSTRVTGPSKILSAMGKPVKRRLTSLRIALGRWSKRDDFFRLAAVLKEYRDKNKL